MKKFFKEVISEMELRLGEQVTLKTKSEQIMFRDILLEFEQCKLGTRAKQLKRRATRNKSIVENPKVEVSKLTQEIYLNCKLHTISPDAFQLIEEGYRKGASYNAPGNSGGAYNETISNEGVMILEKYDISLEELALVLYYRTLGTELGNQQKDMVRNGVEIPHEVPRIHQDLYLSSYLAARSAKIKYKRASIGTEKVFSTYEERIVYGGSAGDLKKLSETIISADKCYIYDEDLDEVLTVPRLLLFHWALSAGGKVNSGDTTIVTRNSSGDILYDGWSDKKTLADIQANGTLNDDFTKLKRKIISLVDLKMLKPSDANKSRKLIEKYQKESNEIELNYKNAALGESKYFLSLGKDKMLVSLWMDAQESFYKRNKTSNHVDNSKKADGFSGSTNSDYMEYLMEYGVHKSATRCKVINRIAIMHRLWLKYKSEEIPFDLDTQGIVSNARETVMQKHSECINKLNDFSIESNDNQIPLGDVLTFYDTMDMLQISKIDEPKDKKDFDQYLKRNTQLIMGGYQITPDVIKKSLEISDLKTFLKDHTIVSEERIMYDTKQKYVTGKVIQLFTVYPNGRKRNIGFKSYRSKHGFTGKTSNTIQWSVDIQKKFKEHG